jgi:hypothetical protein
VEETHGRVIGGLRVEETHGRVIEGLLQCDCLL